MTGPRLHGQVEARALDEDMITGCLGRIGFRLRPGPWNRAEPAPDGLCPKLVFAPPEGERASNVHVVEAGSEAARRKLLFRDFLRAHPAARDAWSDFKLRLAAMTSDIYQYGRAKAGPTEILLIAVESWARRIGVLLVLIAVVAIYIAIISGIVHGHTGAL